LRADLTGESRWARAALAAGFAAMASVAFVHGSLLVNGHRAALGGARLAAYAALAAGTVRWPGRRVPAWLRAGLVVSAAAAVAETAGARHTVTDGLLIAGSVLIAGALVAAGRRSLVARVAASAAAALLVVVLVLSVALSAIISSSAQGSQLAALASQARIEASLAVATGSGAVRDARFFAADLAAAVPSITLATLSAGTVGAGAPAAAAVRARLALLAGLYPVGGVGYVVAAGTVVTPDRGAAAGLVAAAARQPVVAAIACRSSGGTSAVTVIAATATTVAAYPECELATSTLLGTVVVVAPLDAGYLSALRRAHPGVSLALATSRRVLAAAGPQPPGDRVVAVAARALAGNRTTTGAGAGRYLAGVPLAAPSPTAAATATVLVVSTTDAAVVDQQDRMERALYLIALGGTLIALLFVAAVGDRITVGLRRLTQVAERVRRGSVGERASMSGVDEVGTLGGAFDSMMAAVEAHTIALQAAAEDETRLRNRLEAVVAGMGDALVATDAGGVVTDFNAAAETLLGVAAPSAIGRPVDDVVEVCDDAGGRLRPLSAATSAPRQVVTGTVAAAGGGRVPVAASVGALEGPAGERAGAVLVMRDLRREQELERMKSEFLSRIGHELRTPLTAIIGYTDLLLHRGAAAAQAARWHEEIHDAAKRLQRVVELLEFVAASEGGRLAVNAEVLDPRHLARDVVDAWSPRLPGGVELQRRVARVTPPVRADRRWLTLAVNELIDNAVKFSPTGGRVALTARPAPGNGAVDISVTDRGLGMDLDRAEEAFAEFVQGDSSDTRPYGGLGLGLALVTRVARAHGGTVLFRSSPGHGSTFTIRLPAERGQTADT
ncbi:MAG TPA: ATP-binding protein, partial [Acidimicrobiales bacterium]|nr:ATP-binding protein [Acidimicrobiales bacterium]